MVEKRGRIISSENGVTYTINRYVDVSREYDSASGAKKSKILAEYSEAKQRNILTTVILELVEQTDLSSEAVDALKAMHEFINQQ
jgi:hypothetical protein